MEQKQNESKPKRNKVPGTLGLLLALILLLLLALFLLRFLGIGFGSGSGFGGNGDGGTRGIPMADNANDADSAQEPASAAAEPAETVVQVVVSVHEEEYLYQNTAYGLEELLAELQKMDTDYIVTVTDDNASRSAYQALTEALNEKQIAYVEPDYE